MLCPGLICVALLLMYWAWYKCGGRRRKPGEPPVDKGWIPLVGHALSFSRDPVTFLNGMRCRHGSIVTLKLGLRYVTVLLDPFQYRDFLFMNRFLVDEAFDKLVWGSASDSASFDLGGMTETAEITLVHDMTNWHTKKGNAPLISFCEELIFPACFNALFGVDPQCLDLDLQLLESFRLVHKRYAALALGVPGLFIPSYKESVKRLMSSVDVVRVRRPVFRGLETADRFALLYALVSTAVDAAHWSLYHLCRLNEAASLRAVHEARIYAETRHPDHAPLLKAVLRESARLHDASLILKTMPGTDALRLGDREVRARKGDLIALYPALAHRHPGIYAKADEFRCDRSFAVPESILLPLGRPGASSVNRLAFDIVLTFLAHSLLRFELEVRDGKEREERYRAGTGFQIPHPSTTLYYQKIPR